MHKKLSITLLIALGACTGALAQYTSPELILVADFGSLPGAGKIDRYDPFSGQYLGSFGQGYFHAIYGVSVVGQEAWVTDIISTSSTFYSRVNKFNFSTGAYTGTIYNPSPYELTRAVANGSNVLLADYGNGTGGSGNLYSTTGTGSLLSQSHFDTARSVALNSATGTAFVATDQGLKSVSVTPAGLLGSANVISTAATYGVALGQVGSTTFLYDAVNTISGSILEKRDASGIGLQTTAIDPTQTYVDIATGHNGMVYGVGYNSTLSAYKINRFSGDDSFFLGPLGGFKLTNTINPQSMAVYAAPEPAPLVLLGILGLAVVVKRRRR